MWNANSLVQDILFRRTRVAEMPQFLANPTGRGVQSIYRILIVYRIVVDITTPASYF